MLKRKLCPNCKIGKYTYEIDKRSPYCPYLGCCDGKKCSMFVKLDKPKKNSFLREIFGLKINPIQMLNDMH